MSTEAEEDSVAQSSAEAICMTDGQSLAEAAFTRPSWVIVIVVDAVFAATPALGGASLRLPLPLAGIDHQNPKFWTMFRNKKQKKNARLLGAEKWGISLKGVHVSKQGQRSYFQTTLRVLSHRVKLSPWASLEQMCTFDQTTTKKIFFSDASSSSSSFAARLTCSSVSPAIALMEGLSGDLTMI